MRIVIDLQSYQSGSRLGGIGRYSLELAKAMARNSNGHEFWIILNNLIPDSVPIIRHEFSDLIPQDRIRIFDIPHDISEAKNNKTKIRSVEIIREDFIKSLNPDFVHITSLFEGLHEEIITSVGHIFPSKRTAVTLYDLIPLAQKDIYLKNNEELSYYHGKIEYLKKSGLLLSISEFSKSEAINLLGIDSRKIVNISSAADSRFQPINVTDQHADQLKHKYGIKNKFLMYTGSFDKRKNHANLIRAFGLLSENVLATHQLLIVGNGWDAIYHDLRTVAKMAGLADDAIIFAGHVTDADLLPLYALCCLFVFPSLAEGFGLPVLEAMSCGTPTICSNCTSLPEVIGRTDAQFDPTNPSSIAKIMQRALTDTAFRKSLKEDGLIRSKKFSWDASAITAITSFEKINEELSRSPFINQVDAIKSIAQLDDVQILPEGLLDEISSCIALNRCQANTIDSISNGISSDLRVGWVTTWNTRCGVASYSKFIIDHFPAQNTIFAPEADSTILPDTVNVKRCWKMGHPDDLNQLYAEIMHAGIEVLIIQFNYYFFDFKYFTQLLRYLNARNVRIFVTFHSTNDPADDKQLGSMTLDLSDCAGLFVHKLSEMDVLKKINLRENVYFLPQGITETKPVLDREIIIKQKNTIATYGFALDHKGLIEVIDALAILVHEFDFDAHLLMVNAEYPATQSTALIKLLHDRASFHDLKENITIISDYLPEEVSLGYLQLADLIIYAYQKTGESSSAAVRMGLAANKPVAVTPIPIFDDVASVVYPLPGCSPMSIAEGVRQIFDCLENHDQIFEVKKKSAKLWCLAHSYESIAHHMFWTVAKPDLKRIDYVNPPSFSLKPSSEPLIIDAVNSLLKTQVGVATDNGLKTSGQAGALIFGPFISVAPGAYNVQFIGSATHVPVGSAKSDVVIKCGSFMLGESLITAAENGVLSEFSFTIPEDGCLDLETRVIVDSSADIHVSTIRIFPKTIR
ncbi:glycosyltransferase [Acidithiobacillus sp.]|uniref:glycosyltransferase n=1 Tax=Acidithiobacillus sp. TaxID=1872118 RepID=UPI003D05476C